MKQTRYSKQRELIYEALKGRCDHPSAEAIYQSLKPEHPSLSLGTVYRNLNQLVREGRAIRMSFTSDRYDANTSEHPHFLCVRCENLYDLDLPVDKTLDQTVSQQGYEVHRHDLVFKGVCLSCIEHNELDGSAN